jgi:hypothetical protein
VIGDAAHLVSPLSETPEDLARMCRPDASEGINRGDTRLFCRCGGRRCTASRVQS